mmetsp:Transcript_11104/g.19956  ORF Transcript_11104/g.19956 Transcript_11104/m.19956 type:complete len:87 (-) Transcript_11104:2570-2830(-)
MVRFSFQLFFISFILKCSVAASFLSPFNSFHQLGPPIVLDLFIQKTIVPISIIPFHGCRRFHTFREWESHVTSTLAQRRLSTSSFP